MSYAILSKNKIIFDIMFRRLSCSIKLLVFWPFIIILITTDYFSIINIKRYIGYLGNVRWIEKIIF